MTQFSVNPERLDPYKNYKFRIKWDGRYVAGISRVSELRRVTEVVSHREGGSPGGPHLVPGKTTFCPIRLERGVTRDTAFEEWAGKVLVLGGGAPSGTPLGDFRRDIVLDFFNEAGERALSYKIYRCWVSEYQALPDLDATSNSVAIEAITLQNEGWERDRDVAEPPNL